MTETAGTTTPTRPDTPTGPTGFGPRLQDAMRRHGPLCAGLDPHRSLVEQWGLTYDLAGLERFALTCVEAFAGRVAAVKPQSAFFEVFGSRGIAVLERVLTELREAGTLTILDAKRGDIGSTMTAYAEAYLGPDAVALSARAPSTTVAATVRPSRIACCTPCPWGLEVRAST